MKVLLISEKTLKTEGFINDNVGGELVRPSIELAQDINLQELIGTKLLDKVCSLVESGAITGDTEYKLLLDEYITPYLLWKVTSLIQIPTAVKTRNLGVVQTNDANVVNMSLKDVQAITRDYDNKASFYANRMTKYLCANRNKYPEYCAGDCEGYKSNPQAFYCPTYLGK